MRNLWPGARSVAIWLILVVILASTIVRFVKLESAPGGFFIDEADGAVNIMCLEQTGHDSYGQKHPVFSQAGAGGFFSPFHMYLGVLWTKIFGDSIGAVRAMAAFTSSLAMLGLFFLAQNLMDQRAALFTVLAACISPWAFPFARQSMDDPTLFPLGLIWGTYYFLRSQKVRDAVLSAIFYGIAFYSYSPSRVQIPLFAVALLFFKKRRKGISASFLGVLGVVGVLLCWPLIETLISGKMMIRYNVVGIFSPYHRQRLGTDSLWGAISVFFHNYTLHFNPRFLFISGDKNLRHSSQFSGELSWLDIYALLLGLGLVAKLAWDRQRSKKSLMTSVKNFVDKVSGKAERSGSFFNATFLLFLFGFLVGLVPPALTWEALPHALRAVGCWPFVCLMTGFILWRAESMWKFSLPVGVAIATIFGVLYINHFFTVYPKISAPWFDAQVKDVAIQTEASGGNWIRFVEGFKNYGTPVTKRYYLMYYGHKNCDQSLNPF